MHERALRTVLLVQAVEESDRAGEVVPLADRADATRAAVRGTGGAHEAVRSGQLTGSGEQFLERRAARLLEHLRARSPIVGHVLALESGASWFGAALLLFALAAGVSLSALDGGRRINILAFPLIGLIAWNALVYLLLLVGWLRSRSAPGSGVPRLSGVYERWIAWRTEALLRRFAQFNAPLAAGLRRFAGEWAGVARPLLLERAKRLFHLAAALVAVGLVAGLYVRGIALSYDAGWESTFLEPAEVRVLLTTLYGPAATLSGLELPRSPAEIAALRWTGTGGGAPAAVWIHLTALTALLYIILPRLLLALAASAALWRLARRLPAPPGLAPYTRGLLIGAGGAGGDIASVVPYAFEPGADTIRGVETLLSGALGGGIRADVRDTVRYGDEDAFVARLSRGAARIADWNVLLMNLASTPEAENHGAVIAGVRDWLMRSGGGAPLLLLVDASAYAARMRGDPSSEQRLAERRRAWAEFAGGYGLRACIVELAGSEPADDAAREAVRAALWTPGQRVGIA